MQLGTTTTICNDVYIAKMCVKSYTCQEADLIKMYGPLNINTGGEFATAFESFASRDYTMTVLPTAADILALTVAGTTSTFEFVATYGDEGVGNIPVLIDTDTTITSLNLAAAIEATDNFTATSATNVTSLSALVAGDITAVEPASLTVSNIVLYVAPQNYYVLPDCYVDLYQNTCIEQKFDVADIMVELSVDEAAARDEAEIRADLWVAEMRIRIQAELDRLRTEDPNTFIAKIEETL